VRRLAALAAAFLVASACGGKAAENAGTTSAPATTASGLRTVELRSGGKQIRAEVAANEADRSRGLMGRTRLGANEGMLFVFKGPITGKFWMKDTLIPLSIAFMTADVTSGWKVIATYEMVPCREDPCTTTYGPDQAFDAALEMNAGWFSGAGVTAGDTVVAKGGRPEAA
jgi:hypothetical protein